MDEYLQTNDMDTIVNSISIEKINQDISNGKNIPNISEKILLSMHLAILRCYNQLDLSRYHSIDLDQLLIYITTLESIPNGKKLIQKYFPTLQEKTSSFQAKSTSSSKFHSDTIRETLSYLNNEAIASQDMPLSYEIVNEFCGLDRGIFPIDSAVYYKNDLIAFIEIDGEFHYKQMGQQLRRKDLLKEFLYKQAFKNIPLFRIRADQCAVIGISKAAFALSKWIKGSLDKRSK